MSRLLAACTGASIGLAVGWLAGQSTRDALALRSLSRPGAPQPPSGHTETPGVGNGPQNGAQHMKRWVEQFPFDRGGLADWELEISKPAARRFFPLDEVAAEFGIDLDEPDTDSEVDA